MSAEAACPARQRIALVMIARDEAACIERALASVRPWVDECLVLDTGSCDDTVRRARQAGARVEHFAWTDDFSAARNAALALADADWHLVLDADEWISSGGDVIAGLRGQAPQFVGQIRVDSVQTGGSDGAGAAPSWLSRVLPGSVRYAGLVHEQPQHSWRVHRLAVTAGHAGYLPGALARKAGRNAGLLQHALAQAPDDAYLWYQLGKDHDVYERYDQALECMDRAKTMLCLQAAPAPAWVHDLTVRSLHALKRCKRHAEGLRRAEAELERWAGSPDFHFALGDLLLDWAADDPGLAHELVPLMESAWRRCLEIGERPDLEGAVAGRGSHLAAGNLALLHRLLMADHALPELS